MGVRQARWVAVGAAFLCTACGLEPGSGPLPRQAAAVTTAAPVVSAPPPLTAAAAYVRKRLRMAAGWPRIVPTPIPPPGFTALAASAQAGADHYAVQLWFARHPVPLNATELKPSGFATPLVAFGARRYPKPQLAATALASPPSGFWRPPAGALAHPQTLQSGVTARVFSVGNRAVVRWRQGGWELAVSASDGRAATAAAKAVAAVVAALPIPRTAGRVWVDASGITIAWSDGPVERWVSSGAIPFAGLWRMARSMRLR